MCWKCIIFICRILHQLASFLVYGSYCLHYGDWVDYGNYEMLVSFINKIQVQGLKDFLYTRIAY